MISKIGQFVDIFTRYFGMAHYVTKRVVIPFHLYQQLELVYNWLTKVRGSPRIFYWWIFNFGLSCFYELVESGKINSVYHIFMLQQTVKKSLKAYIEVAQEQHGFIQIPHLRYIFSEMRRREFTEEMEKHFLLYFVNNNKIIIGKQIVYSIDDINKIFDVYMMDKYYKGGKV